MLVTGGTGFLAGWAIVALLERGYRVRTTIRNASRRDAVIEAVATEQPTADLEFAVADLTAPTGWDDAVRDCDYVLHVASPLGADDPSNPDALIVPAREGALNVLRAASRARVRRVVMTSAANAASPMSYTEDGTCDETTWTTDDPSLPAYRRSKTIAEQAAWDFMDRYDGLMTLTTVLPGAVVGPLLTPSSAESLQVVRRILTGAMPGVPRIGLEIVDVRDEIDLHIRAMTDPAAAGQRFLGTGEFMWMRDIARVLRDGFGTDGQRVKTRQLPDFAVRLAARRDAGLRQIMLALGRRSVHSTAKARELLGWQPRPAADAVLAAARSLIDHRLI